MVTIAPASRADVPAIATTLGEAFASDTVMSTLVSGEDKAGRLARLFSALLRSGALAHGRVDVARNDADIVGAAIWETPATRASIWSKIRHMPLFLRALGWRGLPAAVHLSSLLSEHRPSEPHWYLAQIGTSVHARGQGVGTALMQHRLGQIDDEKLPAYLESSNESNRALYRRFGFTPIDVVAGPRGSSPMRMWRPALGMGETNG